nr:UDP-glucuronate 4-epimerase [Candidatus Cloacimonadota bacterium]
MKYLVTGGAGFIGSHLVDRLLQEGVRVVNVDNFNRCYAPEIKRKNIREALSNPRYQLCEGDIRDKEFLDKTLAEHRPEIVVHLAAMAGVQASLENPELYYDVNVIGTLRLLLSCVEHSISKFVFASSSSVYGNNPTPFKESDNTDNSISPYASTKKAGEVLCHVYHSIYGMSVHCLRFFTVVGPRQRPDLAVHKFVKAIEAGDPIQLRGDASSSRDYTSVYDIVDGIMGSIRKVSGSNPPEFKIYNLGNSYPVRLDQMVQTIEEILGKKARVEHVNFMKGDVNSTYADISLATEELGFSPQRSFTEAVRSFVEWYNDTRG